MRQVRSAVCLANAIPPRAGRDTVPGKPLEKCKIMHRAQIRPTGVPKTLAAAHSCRATAGSREIAFWRRARYSLVLARNRHPTVRAVLPIRLASSVDRAISAELINRHLGVPQLDVRQHPRCAASQDM